MNSVIRGCWSILVLLGASHSTMARSGIRTHLYNAFLVANEPRQLGLVLDLGYGHDLSRSLAYGIDADYLIMTFRGDDENDGEAFQFDHRAYYLTGDPDASSSYFGRRLGLRRIAFEEGVTWSSPIGVGSDVRGGLERFSADLYVELEAQAGGTTPSGAALSGPEIPAGSDIGFGRAGRDR